MTDESTRDQRLEELFLCLKKRKYPESLIRNGIAKAKSTDITELRRVRDKKEEEVIPYVSTHNPKNNEAFEVIYRNLPCLRNDARMLKVCQKSSIIKSKRQSKSLKKILTNAKLPEKNGVTEVRKCGRPNCSNCSYMTEGSMFQFKNGQNFTVKQSMNCASKSLIYVLTCCGCGEHYIGQTGSILRTRMTVHRQQIRDPSTRMLPVSGHIDICAGNIRPNFKVFPLYLFTKDTTELQRINKETLFIRKYKPLLNV